MTRTPQPPPSQPIAPWREQFVEAPEVRLRYLEWGDPGQTPLLLLHGIGQTAHTWAYFSAAGHTVMGDNPVEFEAKVRSFLIDDGAAGK